ncbi:MAG: prepilin peptidase [Candidatus Sumerlaeota bacterium]
MGLLFGSFFNVCIYRIPSGQSVSLPGSYCYTCGSPIRGYDNIPVLSYLILKGRCRTCRSPFSARYALIELLTGCLFLAVFVTYGLSWASVQYCILTGLLLVATFTDFDHWIIPDRISYGGAMLGIALAIVMPFLPGIDPDSWILGHTGPLAWSEGRWWAPAVNSIIGALSGAGLLWAIGFVASLIFRMPAMGLGDSKLLLCIGAFCGWKVALLCIFLASVFGTLQGLFIYLAPEKSGAQNTENSKETLEHIHKVLHDENEEYEKIECLYSGDEKVVLTRILSSDWERPKRRHHLKFGPHLALAAWLLMIYEQPVMNGLYDYLGLQYLL